MRYRQIVYILGMVLRFEGLFLCLPLITALCYGEQQGVVCFAITALICILAGVLLSLKKPQNNSLYARDGFVIVSLSWILMGIMGAIPITALGNTSYINGLFEAVSGFTTTGSTIFSDVEALPKSLLMWRSFTHWIGGMGVLVFIMAILPLSGGYNMNIMKAESPGPSVGKLVPNIKKTAAILYAIYIGLTVLEFIFLLFGRMSVFESLNTAFATAGTGGFGVRNDSIGSYSSYIQIVITVFMVLFGVNFSAYYLLLIRKFKDIFKISEIWAYLSILVVSALLIGVNIMPMYEGFDTALKHSFFQVAAMMSTTGFVTDNFDLWPQFSRTLMVILMFVGACAGSTGGGMKVSRYMILFKTMAKELQTIIHPKSVKAIKIASKPIPHEVLRSVNVYTVMFLALFALSCLLLSLDGHDLVTTFTATATTMNNVGPGLAKAGPIYNFDFFSTFSKIVMIFNMLAGRLELLPILILLSPRTWKS